MTYAATYWPPVKREFWRCPPLWAGHTAFIVACGPSLRGFDLSPLAGRNVIAIKEMWHAVPSAPFMFYADDSWAGSLRRRPPGFTGRVLTIDVKAPPECLVVKRGPFQGLSDDPDYLNGSRTSVHFAINALYHFGVARIGLLGLDLCLAADGATHSHHAPHEVRADDFPKQLRDFRTIVEPLARRGIEVFNCTPGGALDLWPRRPLEDLL